MPSSVLIEPKWYKGFIDTGFKFAEKQTRQPRPSSWFKKFFKYYKTRNNEGKKLYISFSKLPTNILRAKLQARLKVGLIVYKKLVNFERKEIFYYLI